MNLIHSFFAQRPFGAEIAMAKRRVPTGQEGCSRPQLNGVLIPAKRRQLIGLPEDSERRCVG
jgi:hypothetical protein